MIRYEVQLESSEETFIFEVVTGDFDAIDLARDSLEKEGIMSKAEGLKLHVGGYHQIGTGEEPSVVLVRRS